jgi:hypothetical protein
MAGILKNIEARSRGSKSLSPKSKYFKDSEIFNI